MDGVQADYGRWADQIGSLGPLILIIAGVIGVFLIGWGLVTLARMSSGNGARGGAGGGIAMIVIGGLFLSITSIVDIGSTTLGATDDQQARSALFGGDIPENDLDFGNEPMQGAITLLIVVAWVMGILAFIRGFLILNAMAKGSAQQGQSFGHATTLIVAGVMAMNLMWTMDLVTYTFFEKGVSELLNTATG